MSSDLIALKGSTINLYANVHNGKAYVMVGDTEYISGVKLDNPPKKGAYGVYLESGTMILSMFNISTIDRYEPSEKIEVEVDDKTYKYGEIKRVDSEGNTIKYDKYGYLIYSGLDIEDLKEKEGDNDIDSSIEFSDDYVNIPLAQHPSWEKQKSIRVRMVDAGIWFTKFYIGDAEGFSVAYNSDFIGFVETTELLFEHKCKGVAMWTMGQEDPQIFNYLPSK